MKNLIILLIPFVVSCKNNPTQTETINLPESKKTIQQIRDSIFQTNPKNAELSADQIVKEKNDTILKIYFQQKIDSVLSISFKNKDLQPIENMKQSLKSLTNISKSDLNYWKSFLLYNSSIIYKQKNEDKKSEENIDLAISLLDSPKTSEEYALLAACKSFSIQFANFMKLSQIAQEVQNNAKKSLQLNPKNLRAYEVLCSNNFYTPPMFGGMTKVEEYALKGLDCPVTTDEKNYYAPRWGKDLLYDYLIQFLEKQKGRDAEVKKYKKLREVEFPNKQ